jgi:hypothetical protein
MPHSKIGKAVINLNLQILFVGLGNVEDFRKRKFKT